MKRPKTDGIKSVETKYKWELTNTLSDGEEEEVTILQGTGGAGRQASPDPRLTPGHIAPGGGADASCCMLQTDLGAANQSLQ